jgi:hypothetical protein
MCPEDIICCKASDWTEMPGVGVYDGVILTA